MRGIDPYFQLAINGHGVPVNGSIETTLQMGPFSKVRTVDLVIAEHTPVSKMLWVILQVRNTVLESIEDKDSTNKIIFRLHFHKLPFVDQLDGNYRSLRVFVNSFIELFDTIHAVGVNALLLMRLFPAHSWAFDVALYSDCVIKTIPKDAMTEYSVFVVDSTVCSTEYDLLVKELLAINSNNYVFRVKSFIDESDLRACLNNKGKILYLMDGGIDTFISVDSIDLLTGSIRDRVDVWSLYSPKQYLNGVNNSFQYKHISFK